MLLTHVSLPSLLKFLVPALFGLAVGPAQPQPTASTAPRVAKAPGPQASSPFTLKADKSSSLSRSPKANITELDLEAAIQQYPLQSRRTVLTQVDQVQRLTDDLLTRRELAGQAERLGLQRDPLVAALLRVMREKVLSEARMFDIGKAGWPTDAQLEAAARASYESDPGKYGLPKRQRASHILFAFDASKSNREQARAKAAAAMTSVRAGVAFEDLARDLSEDIRSKGFGGDIGYFVSGSMVPEFEAAVEKLQKVGDVSDPVETQFGIHIIKLTDRRPAEPRPFEEIKDDLIRSLRDQAHRTAVKAAVDGILKDAKRDEEAIKAITNKYAKP